MGIVRRDGLPRGTLPSGILKLDGFEIYSYSAHAIEDKTKWLQTPEYGWSNYLNEDGTVKKEGDIPMVISVRDC